MINKLFSNQKQQFSFWDNYPELQNNLIDVNNVIIDNINHVKSTLGDALRYNFAVPGKMLRPAMILLFANIGHEFKNKRKQIINIAASTEMLHNATLIHDDIIDESDTRRGRPSIYFKYGKHIAVYAGDYLFAVSLALLSGNTKIMNNVKVNSRAMQDILVGETKQYDNTYNIDITAKQYLEQIKGKTAVLFGFSCFIGAFEGGLKLPQALHAKKFGELLGEAFQLRDDILDYTVSEEQFKKPVLLDVRDGVYSGPLIFALEKDHTGKLKQLVKVGRNLNKEQLLEIQSLVNSLGGVARAEELADTYTQSALNSLRKHFKDTETRQQLEQLTKQMLNRKY